MQISDPEMAQTYAHSDQDCGRSQSFDLATLTVGHNLVDKPTSRSLCTAPWMRPDSGEEKIKTGHHIAQPHAAHVSTLHSYALHQLGD